MYYRHRYFRYRYMHSRYYMHRYRYYRHYRYYRYRYMYRYSRIHLTLTAVIWRASSTLRSVSLTLGVVG